jgi:hypothetical protein
VFSSFIGGDPISEEHSSSGGHGREREEYVISALDTGELLTIPYFFQALEWMEGNRGKGRG